GPSSISPAARASSAASPSPVSSSRVPLIRPMRSRMPTGRLAALAFPNALADVGNPFVEGLQLAQRGVDLLGVDGARVLVGGGAPLLQGLIEHAGNPAGQGVA